MISEERIQMLVEQREDFIDLTNKLLAANEQLRAECQRLRETIVIYRETVKLAQPTLKATQIMLDSFEAAERWDNAKSR